MTRAAPLLAAGFGMVAACRRPAPAVWNHVQIDEVDCVMQAGQAWLKEDPHGVMAADYFGNQMEFTARAPDECAQALIVYLRQHPDAHIAGVIPEDVDSPTRRADIRVQDGYPGTAMLLVLRADSGPIARSLAVRTTSCGHEPDCVGVLVHFMEHVKELDPPNVIFSVPITEMVDGEVNNEEIDICAAE